MPPPITPVSGIHELTPNVGSVAMIRAERVPARQDPYPGRAVGGLTVRSAVDPTAVLSCLLSTSLSYCEAPMGTSGELVFVVYNPTAGSVDATNGVRAALARHFPPPDWACEVYETTGKEDVASLCRAA